MDNREEEAGAEQSASVGRKQPAPGPWRVYDGPMASDRVFRNGKTVCSGIGVNSHAVAYCDFMWPERAEANARLIAAAPDMLAALRDAEWFLAGIAPAECYAEPLCGDADCEEGGCKWDKLQTVRAAIRKATGA